MSTLASPRSHAGVTWQHAAFALLVALIVGGSGWLLAAFLWPDGDRRLAIGYADDFAPGSVTSFVVRDGELSPAPADIAALGGVGLTELVHVVRLEDGAFLALSGRDPHLGLLVEWRPEMEYDGHVGIFFNRFHAERYALDGTRLFGPAPRSLDRFAIEVRDDGAVVVDLAEVTRGERDAPQSGLPPTSTAVPTATAG